MATLEQLPSDARAIARRVENSIKRRYPDALEAGSPLHDIIYALAENMAEDNRLANQLLEASIPWNARGGMLDAWGGAFGVPRKAAVPPSGTLTLAASLEGASLEAVYGTATVPSGSIFVSGQTAVETLEDVTFAANSRAASVEARVALTSNGRAVPEGASFELRSGSLSGRVSARAAIAFTGTESTETDEQYAFRLSLTMRAPYSLDGYLAALLGHPGVAFAELTSASYGSGTVVARVVPRIAPGTEALRSELEALYRGPATPFVLFPAYEAVSVRVRVAGPAQKKTVCDYINNLAPGAPLVVSVLESLLIQAGARDAQVLEMNRGEYEDGEILEPVSAGAVNLPPRSSDTRFLSRPEWVVFCS